MVIFAGLCSLLVSCSDELDLTTGSKPVPVVYCIFHPMDSVYKVLLSKTFSGKLSALDMAKDPNHIYFKEATVTLEGWNKGYKVWETRFHPSPATRDSGLFSQLPGFSYETKEVLTTYYTYGRIEDFGLAGIEYLRLVINSPELEEPAYSRIRPVFYDPQIEYPVKSYKAFNLCDSIPYYLEFYTGKTQYYDLRCRFRYTEYGEVTRSRSIYFLIKGNLNVEDGLRHQDIKQDLFFRRLAASFPTDTAGIDYRVCTSLDIDLLVGSENFKTYMTTYYTDNDHGYTLWNCFHGGIGLFAQVSKASLTNLKMDGRTKDSLANGQFTRHLKFSKW